MGFILQTVRKTLLMYNYYSQQTLTAYMIQTTWSLSPLIPNNALTPNQAKKTNDMRPKILNQINFECHPYESYNQ